MFSLYKHIEQLAKEHGIKNVSELCRLADIPRSTMSELNMGRSKTLSPRTAEKFASVLGVSVDEVFGTERTFSDEDLKQALFEYEATDEMLEEVKRFAKFVESRKADAGGGPQQH